MAIASRPTAQMRAIAHDPAASRLPPPAALTARDPACHAPIVPAFRFELSALPPAAEALRQEVRAFLAAELAGHPAARRAYTWMESDRAFSRKVGARGWLGMTWPKRYGGHERTAFERYVVLEEMLVAGAPVASHWIADRQTGPLILRYGTEEQRQRYLPGMARGELACCIGMSEPDTGSDLASVRTR